MELAHLILGIRVFNFDIGKGGAGIVDLVASTQDTVSDLQRKLQVCGACLLDRTCVAHWSLRTLCTLWSTMLGGRVRVRVPVCGCVRVRCARTVVLPRPT